MEKKELISIVVPIYNVEKYLRMCIDSIINQTYENLQIILLNDGSTDKCADICDEYAKIDKRIEVVHKSHMGVSHSRNNGIDKAKGDYIAFIDSDDFICEDFIEKLYNAIVSNDAQIAQCNFIKVNSENQEIQKVGYMNLNETKSGYEMIKDLYIGHWENILIWNKLYSIELFKDIKYPEGKIHEDEAITYKVLYKAEKIAIVEDYLYSYRRNNNSITGQSFKKQRLDVLEAYEDRLQFFEERQENELYDLTLMIYFRVLRDCYIKTRKYIEQSESIQKDLIKKYKERCNGILTRKYISVIEKIKALIFFICPRLCYKIMKGKK